MSAPFRELFRELSAELFEAIKGIGEQAVRETTPLEVIPSRPLSSVRQLLCESRLGIALAYRYGWESVEVWPMASDCITEVVATLKCGHLVHYRIDEWCLLRAQDVVDTLDRKVDRKPRTCFCTPRPEHL